MRNTKAAKLWFINVTSFILFSILGLTGLVNWLFLPRGARAASDLLISLRHFLREVHEWTALAFIFTILIHLTMHWGYIKSKLKTWYNGLYQLKYTHLTRTSKEWLPRRVVELLLSKISMYKKSSAHQRHCLNNTWWYSAIVSTLWTTSANVMNLSLPKDRVFVPE